MIRLKTGTLIGASLIFAGTLPLSVSAEWTGGVEGGTVLQGDTKGTSLEFILKNNDRPISQLITAEWVQREDGIDTYEGAYNPKYWFSELTYVFGEGGIRTFGEASLDNYQRWLGGGVGIQLINTATQKLTAEAGAAQITSIVVATPLTPEFNEAVLSSGVSLEGFQIVADLVKVDFETAYFTSDKQDTGSAEVGISIRIPNGALKYSYEYVNNTIGNADAVETTNSSISINYDF